jgi:hypothetical protein
LTSGLAAWLNHRSQVRTEWVPPADPVQGFHRGSRQCYIDALQHNEADIPGLVGLYAKLSSMRAVSSKPVVQRSDDVVRKILDTYLEPDKSFVELREMAIDGSIDLLRGFSDTCRDEFEEMRPIHY